MASRYSIRPAVGADLEAVVAAERRCFTDPWSAQSIATLFEPAMIVGLIGERVGPPSEGSDRGRLSGYFFARSLGPEAEILNLAVVPEHRQRGLGRLLLECGLSRLRERAVESVFLEVRASNQIAQALYRAQGFHLVGVRAHYYAKPVEDALVLRLSLGSDAF
jgi:ribosomal-protein-alanine N-acetyltransferase